MLNCVCLCACASGGYLQYGLASLNYGTDTLNFNSGGNQFARPSDAITQAPAAIYDHFLCELDVPTEYFIDSTNGILYLVPNQNLTGSIVIASQLLTLFDISNSTNIKISGLNFMHTSNSMMTPHRASGAGDAAW